MDWTHRKDLDIHIRVKLTSGLNGSFRLSELQFLEELPKEKAVIHFRNGKTMSVEDFSVSKFYDMLKT